MFDERQTTLIQFPGGLSESYTIPSSVIDIGTQAFNGCPVNSVTIPNNVKGIGSLAFYFCPGLTAIMIPASVTNISNSAFGDCTSLESIMVDSNNHNYCSINGSLFNKNQTTLIQCPGGFSGCYVVPNQVRIIGDASFIACRLTSVMIPSSVTNVASGAFDACGGLTNVLFEGNVPTPTNDSSVFAEDNNAIAYYYAEASGWGAKFDGIPTVELTTPFVVQTTSLPNGANGLGYSQALTASGGKMPYNWTGGSGALPPGLQLATNGVISGVPTTDGTFYFTVEVMDARSTTAAQALFLNITSTPPRVTISSPTPGMQVSNSFYTVTGKSTDIVVVSSVWVQLNNGGWNPATTTNQWTNWITQVTLMPGTNSVQAYAVDASGNVSPTNTVIFKYVVSAPLTVNINGEGTISPNYNNVLLPVGRNYWMKAKGTNGFGFVNWTDENGIIITNGATLKFVMASNLVFTANFADIAKPTNVITAPLANQQVSNANFTITGRAGDNVGVSNVWVQLNHGGWNLGSTTNQYTNWTAKVSLVPDTNIVQAYAVDTSGNVSPTNQVAFQYVLKAPLTVQVIGRGTVTPNDSNALVQIGSVNHITAAAVPGSGFAFSNWTGGTSLPLVVLTNGTTLQFVMVSNLVLQANFADTNAPTVAITNVPTGLTVSNAKFTVKGNAGDNVAVAGVYVSLNHGGWSNAMSGNQWTNWTAPMILLPGTNTVQAYAVDTSGNVSPTNAVRINYWLPAVLKVVVVGEGTVTPFTNGQVLGVGDNYALKAAATNGFAFVAWGGGVPVISNAALTFTMSSNLMIIADFKDVTRPTNAITFPVANQTWSNYVITVTGKAGDNVGVAAVWCQFNNGGWAAASTTNGYTNWSIPTLAVLAGTNVVQAYATDAAGNFSLTNTVQFRCILPPMKLIPAGMFTQGDVNDANQDGDAAPTNVYVSAFYMDANLVSYSQWQAVYDWATNHGYRFANTGAGKAADQPVQTVDWYDAVKWCNARSRQAGLTPLYYADTNLTQVYTNGEPAVVCVNWNGTGYRLPTEAEWEKAARGDVSGQRFPWGDIISESQANYSASPNPPNSDGYTYDLGPYTGYNTNFDTGAQPYTSPVGWFAANSYGLYDMAGNVMEWCWDWAGGNYGIPTTNNPTGPASGSSRVYRGGSWSGEAFSCRTAYRSDGLPGVAAPDIGFRSVLSFASGDLIPVLPMALSAPWMTVDHHHFMFQLSGAVGGNYVLQVSTNLLNWNPVSTSSIPVSGTLTLTNDSTGCDRRFYRVVVP